MNTTETPADSGKLFEMLTDYAAAHQHPLNVLLHLIGIPIIMLGAMIPLTWVGISIGGMPFSLATALLLVFFFFYMTLDRLFAIVFLVGGFGVLLAAQKIGQWPLPLSGWIAAATFFGGYAMQFVGHAIEKSMPVLLRHPVQANLAAPFFVVVELFKLAGLREELFDKIRSAISKRDARPADVLDAQ